ncbi:unnamed protein product [Symbiodinium sp. KB8]|nr:unnamed protein product [Symbiodinium sp. KB8]
MTCLLLGCLYTAGKAYCPPLSEQLTTHFPAMAPSEHLQPEEQAWQAVFERLCERFPDTGAAKVASILRDNNGHAGQAAAAIRGPMPEPTGSLRDPKLITEVLSGLVKKSTWPEVLELVMGLEEAELKPDSIHFNTAIAAVARAGHWTMAFEILHAMFDRDLQLDAFSYCSTISACEKASVWIMALGVLKEMIESNLGRSTIAFSSSISACEKSTHWTAALQLLAAMACDTVQRNTITFNSAITACSRAQRWQLVAQLLSDMSRDQLPRDTITYSAVISACDKAKQWLLALDFFRNMEVAQIRKNTVTVNAMLSACGKGFAWETALHILKEMTVPATHITYASILSTCGHQVKWEHALALIKTMAQSCFMANGVEAGSALAALQGVLGFERAADMLKALRGAYFGSSGWQDTFGCSRHGAAFGPIAEMSEYREDFRAERKPPGPPSLTLLYRSSGLVAVSKPAGFSTEDVLRCLSAKLKTRITQVSRLDLPTSGVLLAAVGSATSPQAWWLLAQFAGRLISKTYLCLCFGKAPAGAEREVSSPLLTTHSKSGKSGYSRTQVSPSGLPSKTRYKVLATFARQHLLEEGVCLLKVWPVTGRTHQIRAHLASVGLPLVGDDKYCEASDASMEGLAKQRALAISQWCPTLFLHCWELRFLGLDEQPLSVRADLPITLRQDLGGTGKREVDPDDQEHVKTLLTSPVMFAAVCKENFRKFDANGDGVLSWSEVLPLVNSLYESFGLQPPREGNLRSFFDATDLNKDGVLSEKEFKKFFECFLRYAFFDVVQKESANNKTQVFTETKEPEEKERAEKADEKRSASSTAIPSPSADMRGGYERQARATQGAQGSPGALPFRVIAPHGISWRRNPEFNDRLDCSVGAGEVVKVLEQWVKTDRGWLPLHDARGKPLLQPVVEDSEAARRVPAGAAGPAFTACRREKKPKEADALQPDDEPKLRVGEEDWKERLDRLQALAKYCKNFDFTKVMRDIPQLHCVSL